MNEYSSPTLLRENEILTHIMEQQIASSRTQPFYIINRPPIKDFPYKFKGIEI